MVASIAMNPRLSAERRFFTTMAAIVLIATFAGFAPSYYLRGVVPAPHPYEPLIPLVIVHGLVFSAWIVLFAVQTSLVAAGRVDVHRRLGLLGVGLVALMIPLGIWVGLNGVHRPLTAAPGIDPLSWAALPLLDAPVFGGLIVAALANRRKPSIHKRLMLIAMVDMLQPALGRALPLTGLPGVVGQFASLAFLVPLIVWDIRTRDRVQTVTAWGSAIVTARILLTPIIWTMPWWIAFVRWASALV